MTSASQSGGFEVWRNRFALTILLLSALSCSHKSTRGLSSISDAIRAARSHPESGQEVLLRGVVTYAQLQFGDCVIQDETGGVRVLLRKDQGTIEAGELVEARGLLRANGSPGLLVEPSISVLGRANLPPAREVALAGRGLDRMVNRRVSFSGTVESDIPDRPGTRLITIRSNGARAVVRARLSGSSYIDRLWDKEVRITGVLVRAENNRENESRVWGSDSALQVLKPAPDVQAIPAEPVRELTVRKRAVPDHRVRVRGVLKTGSGGLRIQDDTGEIDVRWNPEMGGSGEERYADLYGFVKIENGEPVLDQAAPVFPEKTQSREITTAFALHRLPLGAAALLIPVHLHAVVTFYDPVLGVLFVQDGTDGAFVQLKSPDGVKLHNGDLLDLKGFTTPGDFAPNVGGATPLVIGSAPMPDPETDVETIVSGAMDCRWVELKGIVQDAVGEKTDTIARVQWGDLSFNARISAPYQYVRGLIDHRVVIRGTIGSLFNSRRQLLGVQVFVPGPQFVQAVAEATPDLSSLAPRRVDGLLRFSPNANFGHRVRVQGVVTLANPTGPTWISDSSGGMKIQSHGLTNLHPGDLVDVLGFPEVGGFGVAMKGASLTRLRSGVHFDPIEITPEDAIAGSFESQLVQLEGTVMNGFVERADSVIVLRSGPYLFDVRLPLDESLISGVTKRLETGAQIRVAGICSLILDRSRDLIVPRGFEILLSSASGITVLKDAPWLTMSHLLTLSIVMLFVVTLALGWIAMLRRNVRLQTRKLEQANAVTSEALDRARQAESLEQNRKAILELIAKDEPLEKIMARMARAVVQHMPRTLCTIHLHPPCDSRISLSAEGAEKLMGALSRIPLSPVLETSIWKPVSGLFASEDWDGMAGQFAEAGLQGYFAVPILRDSQQAGLIFTFWPEGLVPTEEEVDILESWGRFAGLSVERRGHYQQLSHKAHHDTLTGLYNRASLFEHLEKQLSRTAESSVAVLYIDLDGFKPINDKHGHGAGDAVLQEVSRRIVAKIRQTDVAARMGGDEFVVVLSGIRDRPEAERVGEDLVECIRQPMLIACRELQVSASLGVSLFPDDDSNAEALLKGADQAMYNAKALNRNLGKIELRQTGESLLVA